jgi:predicted O-methyltransferase YrrM
VKLKECRMNYLKKLTAYCESHTTLPLSILDELERETHLNTLSPQMLCGKLQGHLLYLLSVMAQPKVALEIGTFTGYAALCIAKGLPENGILHTIEANPELSHISKKYVEKAGFQHKIHLHIGDAKEIIPGLETTFDFVFIDAAKTDYSFYYDLIVEKVNKGGLIIADNVLWSGKVLTTASDHDTVTMHEFSKTVHQDHRVENMILPLRDGVLIAKKI